jgi:mono/diheme cytochrome c family protein
MRLSVLTAVIGCTALLGGAAEARSGATDGAWAKVCASGKRHAPVCAKPSATSPKGATAALVPPPRPTPAALHPAAMDAATLQKGADLFSSLGCGSCHTLAQAGAAGRAGPSFDGNANLDQAYIVDRVTNGAGLMPAFGGQLGGDDLAALASYVLHAKAQ